MASCAEVKFLSLAILLFGISIEVNDAKKICSIQFLNKESADIAGSLENSKLHWQWVCKDDNLEAADQELTYEEPLKTLHLRKRRDTSFKPNGCSIPFGLPFFFKKTFTPACNSHDNCYHYRQDTRLGCDDKFLQDMLDICNDTQHEEWKLKSCKRAANTYYKAVRQYGESHYG